MSNNRVQFRGNCPVCGRDQAVVRGVMAKHGYKVEQGWFSGICNGDRHAPMQVQREVTEQVVASVREQVEALRVRVGQLEAGTAHPEFCLTTKRELIPWAEAPDALRKRVVDDAVREGEYRIRAGIAFANDMEKLLDEVHGQPLREVARPTAPEPILRGERRDSESPLGILEAVEVLGARVIWKSDTGRKGVFGTRKWRSLKTVG